VATCRQGDGSARGHTTHRICGKSCKPLRRSIQPRSASSPLSMVTPRSVGGVVGEKFWHNGLMFEAASISDRPAVGSALSPSERIHRCQNQTQSPRTAPAPQAMRFWSRFWRIKSRPPGPPNATANRCANLSSPPGASAISMLEMALFGCMDHVKVVDA